MKASEYLLAKAIENNDFELSKLASEIKDTDQDIEFLTKEASIFKGLLTAGKGLMSNNTVRNAAIGTGVGAIAGATTAEKGNRLSGALKGSLVGGALGGGVTAGKNIFNNLKEMQLASQAAGAPMKLSQTLMPAMKAEGNTLLDSVKAIKTNYRLANP